MARRISDRSMYECVVDVIIWQKKIEREQKYADLEIFNVLIKKALDGPQIKT